jgi:hypothetical protein
VRFIIFVIDHATNSGNPAEMKAIDTFNDALRENGQWVFACGIGAPDTATLVDNRDGLGESVPASLFTERDFYSGFWVIDVDSLETARNLTLAASRACNRRVELRPLLG